MARDSKSYGVRIKTLQEIGCYTVSKEITPISKVFLRQSRMAPTPPGGPGFQRPINTMKL